MAGADDAHTWEGEVSKRSPRKPFARAEEAWRRDNVGRAIFDATRKIEEDILKVLAAEGFPEVRMVHFNLFRNLDVDGTRLTDLAARANITKQSMQELVDRTERMGFVERRTDPLDGRAKMVAFSERGLQLLEALHRAVLYMEERMVKRIGVSAVRQIERALRKYNSRSTDGEKS
jgi:DNA-binding MarR family transcriptional regulator